VKLFDATLATVERALDVRLARQAVLAGNLANANTPGFVPSELDFEAAMTAAATAPAVAASEASAPRAGDLSLATGAVTPGAPASPEALITPDPGAAPGLDGNAVDLDRTMAAVAENAIQYGAAAKAAAKKLAILRYVVDGNGA
jgi:flagellar basal-body rod protein FlgB